MTMAEENSLRFVTFSKCP